MDLDEALITLLEAKPATIEKLQGPGKDLVKELREEAGA